MYFTKIDLKDAYYTIPILEEHQKYLKFANKDDLLKFTCLPNGYCHGPRKFTKALKPPLSELRLKDITIAAYLDDCLNMNKGKLKCWENTKIIIRTFQNLGFTVHPEPKSSFYPTQKIEFLGFVINSVSMTITLTNNKKEKLKLFCSNILTTRMPKIRTIASILGKITSSFPAAKFGRLHYRALERCKATALHENKGNFNARLILTDEAKTDIQWWKENIDQLYNDIIVPNPDLCITTDASSYGWGAVMGQTSTGGLFSINEKEGHINVLELKAILFGLQSLARDISNSHIKILTDNSTAVACINKFGTSRSQECDIIAKQIWFWASQSNIWLSATHLPGKENTEADYESRKHEVHTEWKLNESIFHFICEELQFSPQIDLFATRINTQLQTFVSYRPDPDCFAVNAFLLNWGKEKFYAFPPFACLGKTLQKIFQDKAKGILIAPDWPSQAFYTRLKEMSIKFVSISPRITNLYLPNQPSVTHPLHKNLSLLACLVDGTMMD